MSLSIFTRDSSFFDGVYTCPIFILKRETKPLRVTSQIFEDTASKEEEENYIAPVGGGNKLTNMGYQKHSVEQKQEKNQVEIN